MELVERCVLALTNEKDIVYDAFAGVGSSLLAALKNNRRAYGTEWEPKYVDIGLSRIEKLCNDELITRPLYQQIWKPSAKDKIAQKPAEWSGVK